MARVNQNCDPIGHKQNAVEPCSIFVDTTCVGLQELLFCNNFVTNIKKLKNNFLNLSWFIKSKLSFHCNY